MLSNFFRRLFGFRQLAALRQAVRLSSPSKPQGPAAELTFGEPVASQARAVEAQAAIVASREQLAACRALLAVVMRDRDTYEQAVEVLARKVARLEQQRRKERQASRFWVTRTVCPQKVSEN